MYTASPAAPSAALGGRTNPLRRAADWLDGHGRKAWIVAMVLGFVTLWPVGLGLLAYMLMTGRFSRHSFQGDRQMFCRHGAHRHQFGFRSSGNSAFDAYKADTLKRLEDEQTAFETFLQRLRDAKDKQEFDRFMDERATRAAEPKAEAEGDAPAPGAY